MESSEQTIQLVEAAEEDELKDGYQEDTINQAANRATKAAPAPESSVPTTKNIKNKVQKGKS